LLVELELCFQFSARAGALAPDRQIEIDNHVIAIDNG
jgi:hypothetical protein